MASKKIKITEAKILNENNTLFVTGLVKDEEVKLNILTELKDFIGMDSLEFKVKQKSNRSVNRKVVFKMACDCTEIKTNDETIKISCKKCGKDFEVI